MQKNLSARIAERTGLKTPSRNAKNRAAFLAQRQDIKQALEDGWPVKTIWETLHEEGKIPFSYQAFRGYVNRLILSHEKDLLANTTPIETANTGQSNQPSTEKNQKPSTPGIQGFTFNPVPNKEELF